MQGTIHSLTDRGFGFVSPADDTSRNGRHFMHARNLLNVTFDALKVGQRVQFESARSDRGLEARNVQLIED